MYDGIGKIGDETTPSPGLSINDLDPGVCSSSSNTQLVDTYDNALKVKSTSFVVVMLNFRLSDKERKKKGQDEDGGLLRAMLLRIDFPNSTVNIIDI